MLIFVVRRIAYMVLTLFLVSIFSFMLMNAAPGSALDQEISRLRSVGGDVSSGQIEALKKQYGVDDPWYTKYEKWVKGVAHGDFGQSFSQHEPVGSLIWSRLGLSVALSVGSLIIAWAIAIPIGVYSATHRYTLPDNVITLIQFVGIAIPEFLFALVLMTLAAKYLGTDVGGLFSNAYQNAGWSWGRFVDLLKHLWIPLIVISAGSTAWLTRVMRANLLDVLNHQYVQTARAKGASERTVVWKHAARNALHPLVMTLGSTLTVLISGEAIVSIVLNLPTTGPLFLQALISKDMYLAGALLMMLSLLLIIGNLIADILLAWIDPRIRAA
ncbi:MAG TPA: ABC transporter permease [Mycobacteriales bacterium]|nr:ABC transporter permease [Mycobacteriales bacterium]